MKNQYRISSLIICGGLITTILSSLGTAETIKRKQKIKIEYQTKIEQYYDELNEINLKKLKQQKEEYKKTQEIYEKELEKFAKSKEVKIQDEYKSKIINRLSDESDYNKYGVITESDLSTLKKLQIRINEKSDISFLKYCINLEEITIRCNNNSLYKLNNMPSLQNVKKLKFQTDTLEFSINIAQIIYQKMPALEELILPNIMTYEPGIIESMTQLKKIEINPYLNCDIDFKQLGHLEELSITSTKPYDIAIWFNIEEYNYLKENNVNIKFMNGIEEKYLEVLKKIDKIMENIELKEDATDDEILEEVLKYVIKNYTYDEKIKTASEAEIVSKGLCQKFYEGGNLYAALESETQICGNYASMVDAIYDRIEKPEKVYTLISETHAWNIIDIDEKKYYVDATWLDAGVIAYGPKFIPAEEAADHNILKRMEWYKEDPKTSKLLFFDDGAHIPINKTNYEEEYYKKEEINKERKIEEPVKIEKLNIPTMKLDIELPDTTKIDNEIKAEQNINNIVLIGNATLGTISLSITILATIKKKNKKKIKKL